MRAVDTPIGKVVVVPPCDCPEGCYCPGPFAVGETVNIEEERPLRHMVRVASIGGWECVDCYKTFDRFPADSEPCDAAGNGTVSVRYVVLNVLPIYRLDGRAHPETRYIVVGDSVHFLARDRPDIYCLDLPAARPGGVVLVVEHKP